MARVPPYPPWRWVLTKQCSRLFISRSLDTRQLQKHQYQLYLVHMMIRPTQMQREEVRGKKCSVVMTTYDTQVIIQQRARSSHARSTSTAPLLCYLPNPTALLGKTSVTKGERNVHIPPQNRPANPSPKRRCDCAQWVVSGPESSPEPMWIAIDTRVDFSTSRHNRSHGMVKWAWVVIWHPCFTKWSGGKGEKMNRKNRNLRGLARHWCP